MLPSMFEVIFNVVKSEIEENGLTNLLLMADENGKINVFTILLLYTSAALIILTMFYVLKEARNELKDKKN